MAVEVDFPPGRLQARRLCREAASGCLEVLTFGRLLRDPAAVEVDNSIGALGDGRVVSHHHNRQAGLAPISASRFKALQPVSAAATAATARTLVSEVMIRDMFLLTSGPGHR